MIDAGQRRAGHDFLDAFALRGDDDPALDDARRALGLEELRRRDAEDAEADAHEVAQHGAVGVVDHVDAAAVVGADDAAGIARR